MLPTLPKCQYVRRTKNFVDNYLLVCANIKTVNFIECNVLRRKMSLWMDSVFSRNVNWQLPAQFVLDLTRLQAMSLHVRHPWFKTSLNGTVRVFGECYPNNLWFKDSENSSELMGLGPAILKVRALNLSWRFTQVVKWSTHDWKVLGSIPAPANLPFRVSKLRRRIKRSIGWV